MRNVAWIGGLAFKDHMPEFGWRPLHVPLRPGVPLCWEEIRAAAGEEPEALVYVDRSAALPMVGVESFPCPTCFFCIDSHIHAWYPAWAQAFDACAVSLKDHIPAFASRLAPDRLVWLPPFAKDTDRPPESPPEPEWDLLFVGTVDPETTPGRVRFLDELGRLFPGLAVMRGDYRGLFPKAKLVLNVAERGDLNYRVPEALACGACLLTPAIANGQEELFRDGEHLFTYPQGDAAAVAALARRLLAEPERRARVAAAGRAEVEAHHRMRHRARTMATLLDSLAAAGDASRRLARAEEIRATHLRRILLHWAEASENPEARGRYLAAARGLPCPPPTPGLF
ncbi:hypothetical protein dsx2_1316 [Desulfovibrio sp. X2]|uniref:glycosyltransferase family protein n=1 Tax=Desulfovibrio sp. X2 TaxID=941449 RepID=UPI000358D090|nr:glycosyltransferase [Desulfovibrio sp. X2]EPR44688.1 hypothetical protein dsx2_1316 [Desulfovibrio sp. X2]